MQTWGWHWTLQIIECGNLGRFLLLLVSRKFGVNIKQFNLFENKIIFAWL